MRRLSSITFLLPMAILLMMMLAGSLTVFWTMNMHRGHFVDDLNDRLQARAGRLAFLSESLLNSYPGLLKEEIAFTSVIMNDSTSMLLDPSGIVYFANDSLLTGKQFNALYPEIDDVSKIARGGVPETWRNDETIHVLHPFSYPAMDGFSVRSRGLIYLSKNYSREWQAVQSQELLSQLPLVVGMLLLAIAFSSWLHNSFVRPLNRLISASELIGTDSERPIDITQGNREIRLLLKAFNATIERLNKQRTELNNNLTITTSILEHAPDAIELADAESRRIVKANPASCEMLGYSQQERIGQHISDFQAEMSDQQLQTIIQEIQAKGISFFVTKHRRKDGCLIDAEVAVTSLQLNDKPYLLAIWRDITRQKRVQDKLKQVSLAVEQSPNPIIITDLTPCIEYVNQAFVDITGYSREEVYGKNPNILKSGKTSQQTYEELWGCLSSGKPWRGEFINKTKDGEEQIELATIIPLHQDDGQISHYVAAKENITESKKMREELERHRHHLEEEVEQRTRELIRATESLKASNAQQKAILEAANSGIVLLKNRIVIECNERLHRILGWPANTLPGQSTRRWYADEETFIRFGEIAYDEIRAGKAHEREQQLCRYDGSLVWTRMAGKAVDMNDPEQGSVWVIDDITEERMAAEALQLAYQEQEAIFDTASSGIALIKDQVLKRCNRRMHEMFGWENGQMVGKSTSIWYADETARRIGRQPYQLIRAGKTHVREQQLMRRDGSLFWARLAGHAVSIDDPGKGTVWVIDDITREHQAVENLAEAKQMAESATKMKSEFLANMSHEIRTPMNAILGMTHLVSKTDLTTQQTNYLNRIDLSAKHLLGILNDILDLSKIEAGKITLENIQFNLDELADEVIHLLVERADAKGLELLVKIDAKVPRNLLGDPLRLRQILLNFASNAIKFTDEGYITLAIARSSRSAAESWLRFEIIDTGIGISESDKQRLFNQFEQADTSTTRKYGGTGLGLAISRQLTELMGGHIGLESEPGKGSRFWIEVPLKAIYQKNEALLPTAKLRHKKLLLICTPGVVSDNLISMLEDMTFDVVSVASPVAAMADELLTALEEDLAVIMIDSQLLDHNAAQHLKALMSAMEKNAPRLICMTPSDFFARDNEECLAADFIIKKPLLPLSLFNALMHVMHGNEHSSVAERAIGETDLSAIAGAHVLLVEDNEMNIIVATEMLKQAGLVVETAENGQQAIEKVKTRAAAGGYDVILMDMLMPIMDGLTASKKILALDEYNGAAIIAMTANVQQEDRDQCFAAGMKGFVSKPIVPQELWQELQKWTLPPLKQNNIDTEPDNSRDVNGDSQLPGNIDGIDMGLALRNVTGKTELLVWLMRSFVDKHAGLIDSIKQALMKQDFEHARREIHTLKGNAAQIGAGRLSRMAATVEEALRKKLPIPQIDAFMQDLQPALNELVMAIKSALPFEESDSEGDHKEPLDQQKLTAVCQQLQQQLQINNIASARTLEEHQTLLRQAFGKGFARLKKDIDDFDFESALDYLQELIGD